jgi:hypothetical protein
MIKCIQTVKVLLLLLLLILLMVIIEKVAFVVINHSIHF